MASNTHLWEWAIFSRWCARILHRNTWHPVRHDASKWACPTFNPNHAQPPKAGGLPRTFLQNHISSQHISWAPPPPQRLPAALYSIHQQHMRTTRNRLVRPCPSTASHPLLLLWNAPFWQQHSPCRTLALPAALPPHHSSHRCWVCQSPNNNAQGMRRSTSSSRRRRRRRVPILWAMQSHLRAQSSPSTSWGPAHAHAPQAPAACAPCSRAARGSC